MRMLWKTALESHECVSSHDLYVRLNERSITLQHALTLTTRHGSLSWNLRAACLVVLRPNHGKSIQNTTALVRVLYFVYMIQIAFLTETMFGSERTCPGKPSGFRKQGGKVAQVGELVMRRSDQATSAGGARPLSRETAKALRKGWFRWVHSERLAIESII